MNGKTQFLDEVVLQMEIDSEMFRERKRRITMKKELVDRGPLRHILQESQSDGY